MIDTHFLTQVFNRKLIETGSFDLAFKKAVWVAFSEGVKVGSKTTEVSNTLVLVLYPGASDTF